MDLQPTPRKKEARCLTPMIRQKESKAACLTIQIQMLKYGKPSAMTTKEGAKRAAIGHPCSHLRKRLMANTKEMDRDSAKMASVLKRSSMTSTQHLSEALHKCPTRKNQIWRSNPASHEPKIRKSNDQVMRILI